MKNSIKSLKPFIFTCLVFLIVVLIFILTKDKIQFHLVINQTNSSIQDLFFKNITHLGDGLFCVLFLVVAIFFLSFRKIFLGIFAFLLSGVFSQLIKNFIAKGALRPTNFFEPNVLHFVDGVKINEFNSFPSGHTATAFAFFMFLAFIFQKNIFQQIVFAVLACFVAYSRVYLSQHFLIDVFFGAILGILSFVIAYNFQIKSTANWLDKSASELLKKK